MEIPWGKYAGLLDIMVQVIDRGPELKTPRAVERSPITLAVEGETDRWLKDWIQTGNRNPPEELRYALRLRFFYAAGFAAQCELVGIPVPGGGEDVILEELLIGLWQSKFRQMWEQEGDSFSA